MMFGINFSLLMNLTMLPLCYAMIIYLTSPYGTIGIKRGFNHILGGISSVLVVMLIFLVTPDIKNDYSPFVNAFFIIGPREELSKLVVFLILGRISRRKNEHPMATMFYVGMIGLGFAVVENVQYVGMYGESILGIRLFTATIAHMLFGMFMGYWLAKGNLDNGLGNRSVFGVIVHRDPKIKGLIYTFIGLLAAIGYHGLWNYNLMISYSAYGDGFTDVSSNTIMIMLIVFGLVGVKFAGDDLNASYRRQLKN